MRLIALLLLAPLAAALSCAEVPSGDVCIEGAGGGMFGSASFGIGPNSPVQYSPSGGWHDNIVTTQFGCGSDAQGMASGVRSTDSRYALYAALPVPIPSGCGRGAAAGNAGGCYRIEVVGTNGKSLVMPVLDVGPWNTRDSNYVFGTARPQAEGGRDLTGRRTNRAGLDVSCAAASQLGIDGKGMVRGWRFVR